MDRIPKILLAVITILALLSVSNSYDFCEMFTRRDKPIEYSHSHDTQNIFLVNDYHFWRIVIKEQKLEFISTNSNYSLLLGSRYSLVFVAFDWNNDIEISLYDKIKERVYFLWYDYNIRNFIKSKARENTIFYPISAFNVSMCYLADNKSHAIGCLGHPFDRFFKYFSSTLYEGGYLFEQVVDINDKISDKSLVKKLHKLQQIDKTYELITIAITAKDIVVLIKINITLLYCFVDQCLEKDLKVLIDCNPTKVSEASKEPEIPVWVLIISAIVVIEIISAIILWFIFFRKSGTKDKGLEIIRPKPKTNSPKGTNSPKDTNSPKGTNSPKRTKNKPRIQVVS